MSQPAIAPDLEGNGLRHQLRSLLSGSPAPRMLFRTAPSHVPRFCVALLEHLLADGKRRGMVVCIDTPPNHLARLLHRRGIDEGRVTFVDAVGMVAPLPMEPSTNVGDRLLGDVEAKISAAQQSSTPADFVLIDNLSVLACYFPTATIRALLDRLEGRQGLEVYVAAPSTLAPSWLLEVAPVLQPVEIDRAATSAPHAA